MPRATRVWRFLGFFWDSGALTRASRVSPSSHFSASWAWGFEGFGGLCFVSLRFQTDSKQGRDVFGWFLAGFLKF